MRYNRSMTTTPLDAAPSLDPARRRRLGIEIWLLMGLSLGRSAVYAIVAIIERVTRGPLGEQTATLNPVRAARPNFDLTYQILSLFFAIVPVLLALYLLSEAGRSAVRRIGMDLRKPGSDALWGLGLGALIGIPGLALYVGGRALGITVQVQASALSDYWWTIPVLILAALKNGLLEEVLVVGYLVERLEELGWKAWVILLTSALLRASYHLYQGWGPFFANFIMGVIFTWFYLRKRRVMPLVIAHTLLDIAAFVGYAYLPEEWLAALGVS